MYDYIIVDTNLWYHRNYSIHKDLTFKIGERSIVTGGIWGFLNSLKKWEKNFANENTKFYFLFDNATSKSNARNLLIDPSYKMNRKKQSDSFYRGLDFLRLILMYLDDRYYTVYGTSYEADDIAPYIIDSIAKDESKILAISEDLDWARLIQKNVDMYMKKEVYDRKKFYQKYEFPPGKDPVTLYKVIRGDSVDDIPIGLPNFSKKNLIKLIHDYKTIFDVIENINIIPYLNDTWKSRIIENKSRLILNHRLVTFFPIDESIMPQFITKSKRQEKILEKFYKILGFDISKVDKKLYNNIEERENKKKGLDGFFRSPSMKRVLK